MFKKIICSVTSCFLLFTLSAQSNTLKFIKGNISDKTAAVREASGSEAILLSNKAIEFSLDNKEFLGNDRELDGLAVAAIYSISTDYAKSATEAQKKISLLSLLSFTMPSGKAVL